MKIKVNTPVGLFYTFQNPVIIFQKMAFGEQFLIHIYRRKQLSYDT